MNFRLRYSWLVLAIFLGFVAWAIHSQWPNEPLWRKPGQAFAGYDARQNAIYSISKTAFKNKNDSLLRMNAWELLSGELIRVIDCQLPEMNNSSWYDRALLSPDASVLAVYADYKKFVQLINMDDGTPRGPMISLDDPLDSLGFSSDGRLLSLNTAFWVRVWDTQTMKVVFDYKLDKKRIGRSLEYFNFTRSNRVCFSNDNRFLAVDTSLNVHVFDLASMKLRGIAACTGAPRILPDGQTLLVMGFTSFPVISRFQMNVDGLKFLPQKSYDLLPDETSVDLKNEQFVTLQRKLKSWPIPQWLPDKWARQLYEWNNKSGWSHYIRLHNLATGSVDASIEVLVKEYVVTSRELMPGNAVKLVDHSGCLIIEERDNLVAWRTSTYRGSLYWLIEVLLGCLIFFLLTKSIKRKEESVKSKQPTGLPVG